MRMNPQKFRTLFNQGCDKLVSRSRDMLRHIDPVASQDTANPNSFDESILQEGRFWMRTVTWTLVGSGVFSVAWLALARTEEIVVAPGQLEPIGSVQEIQMPLGGVTDQIARKGSGKGWPRLMKRQKPAKNSTTVWRRQSSLSRSNCC